MWALAARQEPLRPLPEYRVTAPIVASGIALTLLVIGGFSAWIFDERAEAIISAEDQAQIDALIAEARDPNTDQNRQVAATMEVTAIRAEASARTVMPRSPEVNRVAVPAPLGSRQISPVFVPM